MKQTIKVIQEVAPTLKIIARTDAKAIEGIEKAIDRAKAYEEAGADGIFPEALQAEEEFRKFTQHVKKPLLANMTEYGTTPYFTADAFEYMGISIVIYPGTSLTVAATSYTRIFT